MDHSEKPFAARFVVPVCAALALFLSASTAGATDYPLTLESCGLELTFDAPPQRVVTVGQGATETLYGLGLGDRVVATSVWFTEVLEQYREIDASIPRLGEVDPSFESILAAEPDLIVIQFLWHIGPNGAVGTREQFHELGIPTYVLPADCVARNNAANQAEAELFSSATLVEGIEDLGRIFDIEDDASAFADALLAREAEAVARAESVDGEGVSAVFWFSSPDENSDPYVAGRFGGSAYMMNMLGIENVIESPAEWPMVGWEFIAQANPTIIVLAEMDRRRFPADDIEVKLEFLQTDPVASQMDAVINDRIVIMDAHAMDRAIRTIDGIEVLANALEDFDLAR